MGNDTSDGHEQGRGQYETWTAGCNFRGQQLNGSTKDVKTLQKIKNTKPKKVKEILTMYDGATFFVCDDGDMSVGGYNGHGILGVGSDSEKIKRIHHLELKVNIVSKGIFAEHVIVQAKDGQLYAAGSNEHNQCGVKTKAKKHTTWIDGPQMKIGIQSITTGYTSTIFLSTKGTMYGCGRSDDGALGMGSKKKEVSTPTVIPTTTKMAQIVMGWNHCVAISKEQST
eukprot:345429_1